MGAAILVGGVQAIQTNQLNGILIAVGIIAGVVLVLELLSSVVFG